MERGSRAATCGMRRSSRLTADAARGSCMRLHFAKGPVCEDTRKLQRPVPAATFASRLVLGRQGAAVQVTSLVAELPSQQDQARQSPACDDCVTSARASWWQGRSAVPPPRAAAGIRPAPAAADRPGSGKTGLATVERPGHPAFGSIEQPVTAACSLPEPAPRSASGIKCGERPHDGAAKRGSAVFPRPGAALHTFRGVLRKPTSPFIARTLFQKALARAGTCVSACRPCCVTDCVDSPQRK